MKVLVVDDSRAMRRIVMRTLRQAGYDDLDIVEAENGALALTAAAAESPDLVLSDWNMPEMNGLEFLQQLRAAGNSVLFGFVTTEGTPEMHQLGTDAGANFFIQKPFNAETLKNTLEGVLS